jgi:hypothetical protein
VFLIAAGDVTLVKTSPKDVSYEPPRCGMSPYMDAVEEGYIVYVKAEGVVVRHAREATVAGT